MADTKITALTALTALIDTDILPVVDDPGGTPVTKKITSANVLTGMIKYGALSVQSGSAAEGTVDATPRKITAWTTDGVSNGTTPDYTTVDGITIDTAGTYLVMGSISFNGSNNATYIVTIYNDTTDTGYSLERKLGTGGDVGNSSVMGLVACSATDVISLYQSTADGSAMTIEEANLVVVRVGP